MNEKKEQRGKSESKTKILIVDDHPIVRQGLMQLINHEPDLVVSAEAENATQALEALEKDTFGLAIIDISLDGESGLELTEQIKSQFSNLPVLILSMHDDLLYGHRALRVGAAGYLAKREASGKIVTEIRLILKKEIKEKEYRNIGKTKILIVDDHPVVRQGISSLLNMESDLVVCAEAEDADQALEALEKEAIDLAIVDISLNGTDGIELTKKIKSIHPDLPVLILTIHDEALYVKRALEAGARGYVNKREAAETIVAAIQLVLSGKQYLKKQMSQDILKHRVQIDPTDDTLEHK